MQAIFTLLREFAPIDKCLVKIRLGARSLAIAHPEKAAAHFEPQLPPL
jgi:hypothetical protein